MVQNHVNIRQKSEYFDQFPTVFDIFEYRDQPKIKWKIYQFVALCLLYQMVYKWTGITQKKTLKYVKIF